MAGGQGILTRVSLVRSVGMGNLVEYARHAIAQAQVAVDGKAGLKTSLPDAQVDTVSFDDALSSAIGRNFVGAKISTGERLRCAIIHAGTNGVSEAATWSHSEPYRPHEVASELARNGLRGSYFHDLNHWHLMDPANGLAVQLMREPGAYPSWEIGAPLRPFLHWYYAAQGRRLAHCGTLGLGGQGVILAGDGGSGKSGTVIGGLLHGLQSVGDDYVLLDADDRIVARPVFTTLKQDQAGVARLGMVDLVAHKPVNWQGKYEFVIGDVSALPIPERLEISALLIPRVTGAARTGLQPVARGEAMIALAASTLYQMPGERESGFRFFSRVTRALPCYSLNLGSDPAEVSGVIGDFIARRA